jgi:hypothetical protein
MVGITRGKVIVTYFFPVSLLSFCRFANYSELLHFPALFTSLLSSFLYRQFSTLCSCSLLSSLLYSLLLFPPLFTSLLSSLLYSTLFTSLLPSLFYFLHLFPTLFTSLNVDSVRKHTTVSENKCHNTEASKSENIHIEVQAL